MVRNDISSRGDACDSPGIELRLSGVCDFCLYASITHFTAYSYSFCASSALSSLNIWDWPATEDFLRLWLCLLLPLDKCGTYDPRWPRLDAWKSSLVRGLFSYEPFRDWFPWAMSDPCSWFTKLPVGWMFLSLPWSVRAVDGIVGFSEAAMFRSRQFICFSHNSI